MNKFYLTLFSLILSLSLSAQTTCETALPVTAGTYTVDTITPGQIPEPICANNGVDDTSGSVWFSYTASADYTLNVSSDLPQNIGNDTRFHVYTGACGNLSCHSGDDDSGSGYLSVASFNVTEGNTYYIAFDNRWSSEGFDFSITEGDFVDGALEFQQIPAVVIGSAYGVVDMNGDFLDDLVAANSTFININFQQEEGDFSSVNFPHDQVENTPYWSMAAGDLDANGFNDLVYGGGSGVSFMFASDDGSAYSEVSTDEYVFSQRSNMVDINNDGHLDAFVCHDVAPNVYYINDGNGNLTFNQGGLGDTPDGGNYGSIWVDYDNDQDMDLFIAKCRGGNSPARINQLHRNNGDGSFTEVASELGLADSVQTWSSAWGDFDNDGDMDILIGASSFADGGHKLIQNNGDGTFTDITEGSGFDFFTGTNNENITHDFDNDGYLDVFTASQTIMFNNGDMTFTPQFIGIDHGPVGDLNNDGFIDLVENGNIYLNQGNENNYLVVHTVGTVSNINGIGARIEVYTEAGIQIRDVRSGDGFKYMSSINARFGLGTQTEVDSIIVYWPSGEVTSYPQPEINSSIEIVEGEEYAIGGVGITENDAVTVSVYPNPAKEYLFVDAPELNGAQVVIFDISGKKLISHKLLGKQVDISYLPSGSYVLKLQFPNNLHISRKFIKE